MRIRLVAVLAVAWVAGSGCDALFGTSKGDDRVVWRVPFATGGSHTQPLILDSVVIFASRSGWVVALDRSDGGLRWKTRVLPEDRPLLARNLAITPTHVLVPAFRIAAWSARIGSSIMRPTTDGQRVFVNTARVYSITADGAIAWVFPEKISEFGFSSPPAVAGRVLYVVGDDGFYALRATP